MEWKVQLAGDNSDLEEISKSFTDDEIKIYKEGGKFYLSSLEFNEVTEASIVLSSAQKILDVIYGGSKIIDTLKKPITIDGIESLNDGKKNQYIFPKSISLKITTYRPTILVSGKVQGKYIYDDLREFMLLAKRDINVEKVFMLLKTGDDDIVTQYIVYETIKDDVGGDDIITANKWASDNKIEAFRKTAQPKRHGGKKGLPQKNTMSPDEARSFIHNLVKCWLNSKKPTL